MKLNTSSFTVEEEEEEEGGDVLTSGCSLRGAGPERPDPAEWSVVRQGDGNHGDQ